MIKLSNILILLLISCSAHGQFLTDSIIARSFPGENSFSNVDLDQDGLKDIIVLAENHASVYWYKNQGNNHFADRVMLAYFGRQANAKSLKVEDFDQDGDFDFCYFDDVLTPQKYIFYRNEGNFHFTRASFEIPIAGAGPIAFSDLNSDGLKDIVVPSNNNALHYKNLGNFQFQYMSAVSYSCTNAKIADLNNDGQNDIITRGSGFFIVNLNNGTGTFSLGSQVQYGTPNSSSNAADYEIFDYDQDGDQDVIYLNNSSAVFSVHSVKVYLNNGTGVFSGVPTTLFTFTSNLENITSLIATNLDSDNIPDLMFSRRTLSASSTTNIYYRASGGSSFQSLLSINNGYQLLFGPVDVNGDNKSELFATRANSTNEKEEFYIMSDTLSYNYAVSDVFDTFFNLGIRDYFHVNDLNQDGKADLFGYPSLRIYSDTSEMIPVSTFVSGNSVNDYRIIDLNSDGFTDLLGCQNSGIVYRLNNGAGGFGSPVLISATTLSYYNTRQFDIKDYDGDGDQDILFTTEDPDLKVHLFLNNGGLNFQYTTPYVLFNEYGSGMSYGNANSLILNKEQSTNPNEISLAIISDNNMKLSCSFFGSPAPYLVFESTVNYSIHNVQILDVDEDGLKDLVYISSQTLVWKRNLGNMTFGTATELYTAGPVTKILLTDYDGDGDQDIAVASTSTQISRISVVENLSFGNFADEQVVFSVPEEFSGGIGFECGDYEGDGDQDFFVFESIPQSVFVLKNILNNSTALQGIVYYDQNQNQVQDVNEQGLVNIPVHTTGAGTSGTSTNTSGNYTLNAFNGAHTITALPGSNWSLTTDSSAYHVNVLTLGQQIDSLNFGFFPTQLVDSAIVTFVGGFPRCNSIVNHWINTKNAGTLEQDGIVSMQMDSAVSFISSNPAPDSISNGVYYWHYDNLAINDFNRVNVHLQFPPFTSMGDHIVSYVNNYVLNQSGVVLDTISDTLSQVLVCGYDPNDKTVSPAGYEEEGYITTENEWLKYTVRFQNTGNDTVFNVRIIDQISDLLDISSFEFLGSSDPATFNFLPTRKLEFKLNNILLPDSGTNFLGSQGYVVFRMKMNPGLTHGQEIKNKASIFFDQNPAVITNTVLNTIYECPENYTVVLANSTTCITNNVQANVSAYSTLDTYSWNLEGIVMNNGQNFNWPSDSAGIFDLTLSITNPLCQQVDSIIPVQINPSYSYISDSLEICQGDSVMIHGAYTLNPGTYYDHLNTTFGCDSIVGIYLDVNLPASMTLSDYPQNTICLQSGTLSVPNALPAGGSYSGEGISGGVFNPSDAGVGNHMTYYTYIDANSCLSMDSVNLSVEDCLGLEELQNTTYSVYPNPARESIHVVREKEGCFHIRLLSLPGEVLSSKQNICSDSYTIDLQTISKGTYLLEVLDEESGKKELFEVIVD